MLIPSQNSLKSAASIVKVRVERKGKGNMLILAKENPVEQRKANECFKSHSKGELAAVVLCGDK